MTEVKKKRKPLGLNLSSTPPQASTDHIRQSLAHGRSKTVTVEVRRKRGESVTKSESHHYDQDSKLTHQEQDLRMRVVKEAILQEERLSAQREVEAAEVVSTPLTPHTSDPVSISVVQEIEKRDPSLVDLVHAAPLEEIFFPEKQGGMPAVSGFKDTLSFVEAAVRRRNEKEDVNHSAGEKDTSRRQDASKKMAKPKKRDKNGKIIFQEDGIDDQYKPSLGLKKLRKMSKSRHNVQKSSVQRTVNIRETISMTDLAAQMGEKSINLMRYLNKQGGNFNLESILDADTAEIAAQDKGCLVRILKDLDREKELLNLNKNSTHMKNRPPVVTIMGHVDHGKTSLLDALRKTDVASREAGGITQHIGAYQVQLSNGKLITFIDTPGHKAFTEMRSRGSKITDIVVLVVAADDGINEQTIEAIRHCQSAEVPIILAINKIDRPNARPDHVRNQLLTYELVVEKLGGTVQDVEVSALKSINLDLLEDAILLQAEILDLKADESLRAKGSVIETRVKKGHGSAATVLIQEGTLKKGDVFVVGNTWGRVKLLFDDKGKVMDHALPSFPVEIVGFSDIPQSGDTFAVVSNEAEAKSFVEWKKEKEADTQQKIEDAIEETSWLDRLKSKNITEQPIIIKSDVQGSLEGIVHELGKIQHTEIGVKIIHKAVGPVNEGDALLAQASGAIIICFNTSVLPDAKKLIESKSIKVLEYRIIYQIVDEIRAILSGMLTIVYEEEWLGKAEVLQVFQVKKAASIAGCMIKEGLFRRGEYGRVLRGNKKIFEGNIKSLKHLKDDVKEKAAGYECGVMLDGYSEFEIGDVLECFTKKKVDRHV